jgi:hypothetical protein
LARASQPESLQLSPIQELILEQLSYGKHPYQVAAALGKGDPKKTTRWRRKIKRWLSSDLAFQQAIAGEVQLIEVMDLIPAAQALGKRARRGRTDAIKLLFEVTGHHNPKSQVDHNHSGSIDINLKMGGRPEPIVEAEVVED